jgi:periplasmic divalent cation tolerance protein
MMLAVYVTCPDQNTAERIATTVVEERLAACANILGSVKSIYRWQNQVEHADEIGLVLKTTEEGFEALRQRVVTLHPYEVPCIVGTEMTHGHAPYLSWLKSQL